MKTPLFLLTLMAAPLAVTPQLFGQVALDGPWYTGSNAGATSTPTLSATNSDTFSWGSGAADDGTISGGALWTSFADQTLANDGDSVELSFTINYSGAVPGSNNNAVRIGLFDDNDSPLNANLSGTNTDSAFSPWRGYLLFLDSDGSGSLLRENTAGSTSPVAFGGTSDIAVQSTTGNSSVTTGTDYAFSFSVTRDTATQYTVAMSGFGTSATATTTNIAATSFNSVFIQATSAVPDTSVFNFSNVSVIPEPASFALIFGALAGCLVVNRRRGRA